MKHLIPLEPRRHPSREPGKVVVRSSDFKYIGHFLYITDTQKIFVAGTNDSMDLSISQGLISYFLIFFFFLFGLFDFRRSLTWIISF